MKGDLHVTTRLISLFVACLYIFNVASSFTPFVSISSSTFISSISNVFSLSGEQTILLSYGGNTISLSIVDCVSNSL